MKNVGDVVCAIIEQNGKFILAQRSVESSLPLKWEFPGGKVEKGETEKDALKREIEEELALQIEIFERMTPSYYCYQNFSINLIPYRCKIINGEPIPIEHAKIEWVDIESARSFDLAKADLPILEEYLSIKGEER